MSTLAPLAASTQAATSEPSRSSSSPPSACPPPTHLVTPLSSRPLIYIHPSLLAVTYTGRATLYIDHAFIHSNHPVPPPLTLPVMNNAMFNVRADDWIAYYELTITESDADDVMFGFIIDDTTFVEPDVPDVTYSLREVLAEGQTITAGTLLLPSTTSSPAPSACASKPLSALVNTVAVSLKDHTVVLPTNNTPTSTIANNNHSKAIVLHDDHHTTSAHTMPTHSNTSRLFATAGDTYGIGLCYHTNTIFITKNGILLQPYSISLSSYCIHLINKYKTYIAATIHSPNQTLTINFGTSINNNIIINNNNTYLPNIKPFIYDLTAHIANEQLAQTDRIVTTYEIENNKLLPYIRSYLIYHAYTQTLTACDVEQSILSREAPAYLLSSLTDRSSIRQSIQVGHIQSAIDLIQSKWPTLLQSALYKHVPFALHSVQFVNEYTSAAQQDGTQANSSHSDNHNTMNDQSDDVTMGTNGDSHDHQPRSHQRQSQSNVSSENRGLESAIIYAQRAFDTVSTGAARFDRF